MEVLIEISETGDILIEGMISLYKTSNLDDLIDPIIISERYELDYTELI